MKLPQPEIPVGGLFGDAALREAAGSFQDIITRVDNAVRAQIKLAGQDAYACMRGLWPDAAVFSVDQRNGSGSKLLSFPYALKDDGSVTLGQPTEVVETFAAVKAKMTEAAGALIEAAADAEGEPVPARFKVRVIRAGLSGNGNYYPDAVLREAAPLFNGARVFVKSDQEHLKSVGKDVRNIVGRLSDAVFVEGQAADTGEMLATLTMLSPSDPFSVKLREAVKGGMQDVFGLSIDADGKARTGKAGGRPIRTATAITKVRSVDLIVDPGAGGGVISFIEALSEDTDMALRQTLIATIQAKRPQLLAGKDVATLSDPDLQAIFTEALADPAALSDNGGGKGATVEEVTKLIEAMNATNRRVNAMRDRVNASKLPATAKARIVKEFEGTDATFTEAQVDARIKEEVDYLAPFATSGRIAGLGDTAFVESMEDRRQKVAGMLDAFFDPEHKDHRHTQSFRECYCEITGDKRVTGMLKHCDEARLREALGSESFDAVLGDSINRRMVADYNNRTELDVYRDLVTVVPVNDFRNQERTRWGGYGDLPVVAEADPYTELASPDDDDPATYKVAKRGGTERVTMEMVRNDDVGAIRRVPVKLSRAAKRTLSRGVMMLIPQNRTIYDGKALFHADHGNLGTAALGSPSLAARRLAMKQQKEFGTDEPLGLVAKHLWVPDALEEAGNNLFRRATEQDKTFVQSLNLMVHPVWCWTDADNWAISCDTQDCPVFELGFLDGNEEPELFVQDSPTAGSLFSHDSITYKIRHIWGLVELDFRGIDYSIVP